jgi:hypothetical protein
VAPRGPGSPLVSAAMPAACRKTSGPCGYAAIARLPAALGRGYSSWKNGRHARAVQARAYRNRGVPRGPTGHLGLPGHFDHRPGLAAEGCRRTARPRCNAEQFHEHTANRGQPRLPRSTPTTRSLPSFHPSCPLRGRSGRRVGRRRGLGRLWPTQASVRWRYQDAAGNTPTNGSSGGPCLPC